MLATKEAVGNMVEVFGSLQNPGTITENKSCFFLRKYYTTDSLLCAGLCLINIFLQYYTSRVTRQLTLLVLLGSGSWSGCECVIDLNMREPHSLASNSPATQKASSPIDSHYKRGSSECSQGQL